jgi:hypothetical protein
MKISFMPICANFHETGHLSLIFEDVFCNGFYAVLIKNVENVDKILCMPVSKVLPSLPPSFTTLTSAHWHYLEVSYTIFHPDLSRNV